MENAQTAALGGRASPRSDGQNDRSEILIWDPYLRLFHWSLAACFVIAFVVEDDLLTVHVWAGYLILALIAFRLIWGLVGPRYALWSEFVKTPSEILAYLSDVTHFRAGRHLGHNPAGGAMILALLVSLAATGVSGLALYGAQEFSGPLAELMQGVPPLWGHALEDVHEVLANLTLLLVALHLVGVILASFQHGENLPKAMITGYKRRNSQ